MRWLLRACPVLLAACSSQPAARGSDDAMETTPRGVEPPVVTNAGSPVAYPPILYRERVEGTVILRLYADSNGVVVPESTRLAEGSGYPQLDSAALAGVARMTFAPARRNGSPVAGSFLQPVHFRRSASRPPEDLP